MVFKYELNYEILSDLGLSNVSNVQWKNKATVFLILSLDTVKSIDTFILIQIDSITIIKFLTDPIALSKITSSVWSLDFLVL